MNHMHETVNCCSNLNENQLDLPVCSIWVLKNYSSLEINPVYMLF